MKRYNAAGRGLQLSSNIPHTIGGRIAHPHVLSSMQRYPLIPGSYPDGCKILVCAAKELAVGVNSDCRYTSKLKRYRDRNGIEDTPLHGSD